MRLSAAQLNAVFLFVALGGAPVGLLVWSELSPQGSLVGASPLGERKANAPSKRGDFNRAGEATKEAEIAGPLKSVALGAPLEGPDLSKERVSKNQGPSPHPDRETQFVTELRALGFQRPEESLALAREAREAFPEGATIAERTWYEARALVELGDFREAQAVARWLVERHPSSSFSRDLERHLLSHPLGLPPRRHQL